MYLGFFSETGCTFEVVISFKFELPFKVFGGSSYEYDRKQNKNTPIECREEGSPLKARMRGTNFFKEKIDLIMNDKFEVIRLQKQVKEIKMKRSKEKVAKAVLKTLHMATTGFNTQESIGTSLTLNGTLGGTLNGTLSGTMSVTLMDSKITSPRDFSKIDEKIQTVTFRKAQLEEFNFKRKLFLLNKREFINEEKVRVLSLFVKSLN